MHLRGLIIDDEELARKRLRKMLQEFEQELEVIAEAGNGEEAVEKIDALHPDIIFLDIQMPGCDGFEVVRRMHTKPFIIFVTAYDEYALRAFEENSIDYLLKPIDRKRLVKAVEKLRRLYNTSTPQWNESIERLLSHLTSAPLKRLQVKSGDKIFLVNVEDIVYFEAKDKYTFLYTIDQKHIIDSTLTDLERTLDAENFIRIHRSNIINLRFLHELVKWFGGKYKVKMKDKNQTELIVSRGYVDLIHKL
jgi:two-component system LytT family response regulator